VDRQDCLSYTMRRLLLVLLFATAVHADEVLLGPAPAWVEPATIDLAARAPRDDVRYGVYTLLDDHQVRVTNTVVDYSRRVRRVLTPGGVQNASELSIDFDPTFETVVLHSVAVLRDGKRIDELPHASIRVIDKEEETEDRIYDGTRSALVILNDVRPGDVIDYAWSIEGANPILAGKFADEFDLTAQSPAHRIRHRLLWPASRPLYVRSTLAGVTPTIETRGAERIYTWERHDVAPLAVEDQIPDWLDPYDHVQLTEFASWHDVALWSVAMFQLNDASRAAVHALAARIRREHPRDPVTAAIRFVQDDIRYLGIEMGRNSHEPHQPADVLAQRWGDCKDKALLLSALLRELGVEAYPAMVNTKQRHALDQQLPSPFLFDHVITEVLRDGKTYWIDGTLADQGGTLATIDTPNDERALIVRPETKALTPIVMQPKGSTTIEQTYTARDYTSPVLFDVVTTYRGGDADLFRSSMSSDSLTDLGHDHLNRYAAAHPKIEALELPQIRDDRQANVITLRERYRIRDLWRTGEWSFTPRAIVEHLKLPETRIRTMPLAFDYPLDLTQRVVVNLPDRLNVDGGHDEVESEAFRYESDVVAHGNTVTATYRLHATRDGVDADSVADHLMRINDVTDSASVSLDPERDAPLVTKARRAVLRHASLLWVLIGLAAAAWIASIWRARQLRAAAATTA
jgi:transglutaminase-like putative cysteine protease